MGRLENVKWLFCTWQGIEKVKRFTNLVCGGGVILCAVLSILNILESLFDLVGMIRQLWNGLFGTLMIMMQLNVMDWITRRFGFLTAWFGRGMFYLFVGTNIMNPYTSNEGIKFITYAFGFACVFVGTVELIFGFKCTDSGADGRSSGEAPRAVVGPSGAAGPSISSGGPSASGEPTFNVTVTPSQALQGAKMAAKAGATLAPLAAAQPAGGKPANPFLGNSHLSEQRT